MTINEKFELIIKILFGGNKRAFAHAIGISPTVVENVVGARKGKPSFDVLVKVCANANISAEWLLLGTGDNFKEVFLFRKDLILTSPPGDESSTGPVMTTFITGEREDNSVSREEEPTKLLKELPLIPLNDIGQFALIDEDYSNKYDCFYFPESEVRDASFLIRMPGDSMQPYYYPGDILSCKNLSTSDIFFQWGRVYAIETSQGTLVKRVEPGSTEEYIKLVSENERYKPFEISKHSISKIALILGFLRAE